MNQEDNLTNPFSAPRFKAQGETQSRKEYGLKISRLPLSRVLRSNRNPLLWVLLPLYRVLGSPEQVSVGLSRPDRPEEITRDDLPTAVEPIVAQQHLAFQSIGFERVAFYRGPSTGAVASAGEVYWHADSTLALNLVVQSIRYPVSKSVQPLQSLITPLELGRFLVTYSGERSISCPQQILSESNPNTTVELLYQRHRDRLALHRNEIEPLRSNQVMPLLVRFLQLEIDWYTEQRYLSILTVAEYRRLRMLDQLVDFRVVKPHTVAQYLPQLLFALMLVAFVGMLARTLSVYWTMAACGIYLTIAWICRSWNHRRLIPSSSDESGYSETKATQTRAPH